MVEVICFASEMQSAVGENFNIFIADSRNLVLFLLRVREDEKNIIPENKGQNKKYDRLHRMKRVIKS